MRTVDTVLENLDVMALRNITYQVIHLSNLTVFFFFGFGIRPKKNLRKDRRLRRAFE